VLRSYDNRACYAERRPDVYLYSGVTGVETKVVCDIDTGRPKSDSDFGTYPKYSDTLSWLWKKERVTSSRLLVIATPFREGRHYATSPRDFVPVVEHLERLHAVGYVHGDIRCFNLAMGPKGGLFDFDLGGKLQEGDEGTTGALKYPYGYIPAVRDGTRLGNAEEPITKFHDVYALTKVIFGLHVLQPNKNKEEPAELATTALSNDDSCVDKESAAEALSETELLLRKMVLRNFGDSSEDYEKLPATEIEEKISAHMADLKKFLENAAAQQWIVNPQSAFQVELVKHGCFEAPGDESSHHREGSGTATGSPPKKLPEPTHRAQEVAFKGNQHEERTVL
jgi:hypothetical protein